MNELQSLKDIFKDRIFKIPDYKRGYVWTKRHLTDFWEDTIICQRIEIGNLQLLGEIPNIEKKDTEFKVWLEKTYPNIDGKMSLKTHIASQKLIWSLKMLLIFLKNEKNYSFRNSVKFYKL